MDAGLHRLALQVKVELPRLRPQRIKLVFPRGALRSMAQLERGQAMVRQHDQLPALVAADMLGRYLALVQHTNFVMAGANRDRPARQPRRCRIAVAVKLDSREGTDDYGGPLKLDHSGC